MALKFTPKNEKDLSSGFDNLPPGRYPFTVLESGITQSKSAKNKGREMCAVKLVVHGPDFDKHCYDYFSDWFSEWKLKHFCEVVELAKDYASGEVAPEGNNWKDRQGFLKLKIAPAQGNFEAKNEVVDYLPEANQTVEALSQPKKVVEAAPEQSDDVPF